MAPGGRRRQTLGQGLDKEVYQVVRNIIDERTQYDGPNAGSSLTFSVVYDHIKISNSSLNRKPKRLLEDSIERVLDTIEQDALSSDSEDLVVENQSMAKPASNGLNKSIVGRWSTTTTTPSSPQPSKATFTMTDAVDTSSKQRLPNGEAVKKKRKATTSSSTTINISPPTHITLANMGGVAGVIQQFKDLLVVPLTKPEIYASKGLQPPRGILIHGPPGCGKTMLANAFAAELGVNFISISAPSVVSGMSGESEKALREHFDEAKKAAPCLMFIDEIDAITPKRESAQREMEKRIVAQLLLCMDDLALEKTDGKPVIVLAATNRPDSLDTALRRAGRFDKEINMNVPNETAREQILRTLTLKITLAEDVDFTLLAKRTPGFVGADLNDLVSTAGAAAIKRDIDFLEANSENTSMDIDNLADGVDSALLSPDVLSLRRLIRYTKASSTDEMPSSPVTFADFLTALPKIQPSALREGFATIPTTTFSSIGALDNHIHQLKTTIIDPILNPTIFANLGITPSSGALLWGPPGCGKTLLAKACANSSHANFISVKGPELLNKYVGESERAVRQIFNRARHSVPVIIFFDELDALVPRRDGTMSEASARVVNTLLTELDGVGNSREGIYVIAATNRPDIIDPAMCRPGRLDTLLFVGLPDADGRVDVLRTLTKRLPSFVFDDDAEAIARACEGFSGADLEGLVRHAAHAAIERCRDSIATASITTPDLETARLGLRPSVTPADMARYELLRKQWGRG